MLKNHKILIAIIVLSTIGILTVLGIWLQNSYKSQNEILVSKADQSLIAAMFHFYSEKEIPPTKTRGAFQENIAADIKARYHNTNIDTIYAIFDRNATRHNEKQRNQAQNRSNRKNKIRDFNPWFFVNRDIKITTTDLDSIQKDYVIELNERNIQNVASNVILKQLEQDVSYREYFRQSQNLRTRPLLINPESNLFIYAELTQSWKYILSKMAGQIIFSLLLVLTFIGTFISLFKTIRRQQKLAVLQRSFVNNMTHELKTPLSTVSAALEAIQRYGAMDDKARMNKYLDMSKNELEHLSEMIERVLQFNVGNHAGLSFHKEEFDIVALLNQTIESFTLSSDKEVHFNLTTDRPEIILLADKSHIKQILSNLIDNAMKYNDRKKVEISITLTDDKQYIRMDIKDNGIGIPKTYHKNIFDVFFRVPNGELYSVKGFGLGLAFVKQVIEGHSGSISVSSEYQKGSTFTIQIPKHA